MAPQTEGSTGNDFRAPHHLIYAGWLCKPSNPSYGYKHTHQHSRDCEFVFVSWGNCRFVDSLPRVVTGHPLLILVLDRGTTEMHGPVSPSLWMSPASSTHCRHLMFFCLHIRVSRGLGTWTHTQTQMTQTHTCTHACARHRDTNTEEMCQYLKNQWFIWNTVISYFS